MKRALKLYYVFLYISVLGEGTNTVLVISLGQLQLVYGTLVSDPFLFICFGRVEGAVKDPEKVTGTRTGCKL